jgi:hypothetical protein
MTTVKSLEAVLDDIIAVSSLFHQSDTSSAQLRELGHQGRPTWVAQKRLTKTLNLPVHRCQASETPGSDCLVRIIKIARIAFTIGAVQPGILESKPTKDAGRAQPTLRQSRSLHWEPIAGERRGN